MRCECLTTNLLKHDKWLLALFWVAYTTAAAGWVLSAASPPNLLGPDLFGIFSPVTYYLWASVLLLSMAALFPLLVLRGWVVRKRTEKGLKEMMAGVSAATGTAFFRSLASHLCQALEVDAVIIGRLPEKNGAWLSTEVIHADGRLRANRSFPLAGTACNWVLEQGRGILSCKARQRFAEDPLLARWGQESFAGMPLIDSSGRLLGVLAVMGKRSLRDRKLVESLLQVFAVRAAGELERKQGEEALNGQSRFYQRILNALPIPVFFKDGEGVYLGCNAAFEKFIGRNRQAIIGRTILELVPAEVAERHRETDQELLQGGGATRYETSLFQPGGDRRQVLFHKSTFEDETGCTAGLVGSLVDITRQRSAEQAAHYLAHFDSLTHLPNQVLFTDRLNLEIAHSIRLDQKFALFALDLDHFKKINNALGHQAGDELLKQVSDRLAGCLRQDDTVAKMGGDSFTLLLPNLQSEKNAGNIAQKLLDCLKKPFHLEEKREVFISASIGIALFPVDGNSSQVLLKNADTALNQAKEKGRNRFRFYATSMNARAEEQIALLTQMRRALEGEEFTVHYQPQFCVQTEELVGAEALIRWHHPQMGLVPPDRFVPLAEDSGLILPIGEWVLLEVCRQLKRWLEEGLSPCRIAVNLSPRQFQDPGFYARFDAILQQSGIPPSTLGLEVTESAVMENIEMGTALLKRLKLRGIHLSIDDFGTGHSSLSYLKRFPVDTLKVDRSFIKDIPESRDDVAIVSAVVAMAHNLGIKVLAEGVQREAQLEFLAGLGCDEIQGFLKSKPLPEEIFEQLLRNRRGGVCSAREKARGTGGVSGIGPPPA